MVAGPLFGCPLWPFRNIADAVADEKLGPVYVLAINRGDVVAVARCGAVRCVAQCSQLECTFSFGFSFGLDFEFDFDFGFVLILATL